MLETDPHGLSLTLVSVCTVFACLLILFGIYQLLGDCFTGKFKRKTGASAEHDEEVAAAIALALRMEAEKHKGGKTVRIITINRKESPWNAPERSFRRIPSKK